MIEFKEGNILESQADAVVNTVNCVGVMGRGIALQFKNTFPSNYKYYKAACDRGEVQPGHMLIFETGSLTNPRFIVNFPTKRHWKGKSRIEDIESGLDALVEDIKSHEIQSIAIPPLGSGLGGLSWLRVKKEIEQRLAVLTDVRITIYEPTTSQIKTRSAQVPSMTAERAAVILLIREYLGGLMDPFITLLEVHKLMYFMQTAGQPLRLSYVQGRYGPYASNLRHLLNRMEGHFITGYGDGGDAPGKPLELVPGAVKDANDLLVDDNETRERLSRVSDLVTGFESSFGLELLATVHWVLSADYKMSNTKLVESVYAWDVQKKKFSNEQILLARETLASKNWLPS